MGAGACKSGGCGGSDGGGNGETPGRMRRAGDKTLAEKISLEMGVKIVLLGDTTTGKTSITLRFVHNEFLGEAKAPPTIG